MSLDLSTFKPSSVKDLVDAITGQISQMGEDWWKKNSSAVEGYVKSLAQAAKDTATSLAEGTIPKEEAEAILKMQKEAFETSIKFGEYMTLALAQNVVDEAMKIVGAAIKNITGIDLAV